MFHVKRNRLMKHYMPVFQDLKVDIEMLAYNKNGKHHE